MAAFAELVSSLLAEGQFARCLARMAGAAGLAGRVASMIEGHRTATGGKGHDLRWCGRRCACLGALRLDRSLLRNLRGTGLSRVLAAVLLGLTLPFLPAVILDFAGMLEPLFLIAAFMFRLALQRSLPFPLRLALLLGLLFPFALPLLFELPFPLGPLQFRITLALRLAPQFGLTLSLGLALQLGLFFALMLRLPFPFLALPVVGLGRGFRARLIGAGVLRRGEAAGDQEGRDGGGEQKG
jgi:hypothetical protein